MTLIVIGYTNLTNFGSFFAPAEGDVLLLMWVGGTVPIIAIALLASASERDTWGPRVRSQIPRNPLGRVLAFLFYSGSGGGVLWCLLTLGMTFLFAIVWYQLRMYEPITAGGVAPLGWSGEPDMPISLLSFDTWFGDGLAMGWSYGSSDHFFAQTIVGIVLCVGYVIAYTLIAMAIRKYLIVKSKTTAVGAIAVMLAVLGAVIPIVMVFLLSTGYSHEANMMSVVLNPIAPWIAVNDRTLLQNGMLGTISMIVVAGVGGLLGGGAAADRRAVAGVPGGVAGEPHPRPRPRHPPYPSLRIRTCSSRTGRDGRIRGTRCAGGG